MNKLEEYVCAEIEKIRDNNPDFLDCLFKRIPQGWAKTLYVSVKANVWILRIEFHVPGTDIELSFEKKLPESIVLPEVPYWVIPLSEDPFATVKGRFCFESESTKEMNAQKVKGQDFINISGHYVK
jgi:hypothetical protein